MLAGHNGVGAGCKSSRLVGRSGCKAVSWGRGAGCSDVAVSGLGVVVGGG